MTVFKKIESDAILEKKSEVISANSNDFKFLSTLYWPIARFGLQINDFISVADYPIWPSLYFSSESLLLQPTESTKYFVDFYKSNMIPVNVLLGNVEGDWSPSFYVQDPEISFSRFYFFFIPKQEKLFSTAWAHYAGSGGFDSSFGIQQTYPTKAIYNQIKTVYDQHDNEKFIINGEELDHFFYVTLDKKTFTGSIAPNTFVLPLAQIAQNEIPDDETRQKIYTFTDYNQELLYSNNFGRYSYIVSGTLNSISSSEVFGTIYYDQSAFILNTDKIQNSVFYSDDTSFINTGSSITGATSWYLSGSQSSNSYMFGRLLRNSQYKNNGIVIDETNPFTPVDFEFKLENDIINSVYFLDINYDEFNYTNNPTCFKNDIYDVQSNLFGKQFKYPQFKTNPTTYITSIGLYNEFGEMLAIAKFPFPLKKDFGTRYSVKIVIKY